MGGWLASQAIRARRANSNPAASSGTSFHTVAPSTRGTNSSSCRRHACAVRATHELELVAKAARSDSQVSDCHGAGTITGRSAKCSTWYESAPAKAVS